MQSFHPNNMGTFLKLVKASLEIAQSSKVTVSVSQILGNSEKQYQNLRYLIILELHGDQLPAVAVLLNMREGLIVPCLLSLVSSHLINLNAIALTVLLF